MEKQPQRKVIRWLCPVNICEEKKCYEWKHKVQWKHWTDLYMSIRNKNLNWEYTSFRAICSKPTKIIIHGQEIIFSQIKVHQSQLKMFTLSNMLPRWLSEFACQCRRHKRRGFDPCVKRLPGEGNGSPLRYSCLESPMDRRAWQTTDHRVTKELGTTEHTHKMQDKTLKCANQKTVGNFIKTSINKSTLKYIVQINVSDTILKIDIATKPIQACENGLRIVIMLA